jgi:membrane protease YdiL (CAAX protease family)
VEAAAHPARNRRDDVFRGDLLRALCGRVEPALAITASSVVFALYHCDLTPLPWLMKGLFGAIAGLATLRTRALLPAMISHALLWTIFADN